MNFLKTFFGQIVRKTDIDFQNSGVRKANVQTHIDYTGGLGGVIEGLDVFKTSDGLTLIVTPGVFYTKGSFSDGNSTGGGERCEVYETQYISGLSVTAPSNGQPKYILVYAKPSDSNVDPSISPAEDPVTSINIQTGEEIPSRQYTTASILTTPPIFASEVNNIAGALPIALIQIDYDGTTRVSSDGSIQKIDTSVRTDYTIGGVINIPKKRINSIGLSDNFIKSRMIGDDQILARHIPNGAVDSVKLAPWDGVSTSAIIGSGIASAHIKSSAVTYPKISITGSLNNFSETNYVFNGSFDVTKNTAAEEDLVGWTVYNQVDSDPSYTGPAAGVFRNNSEHYNGSYSAQIVGADPALTSGVQLIEMYQDVEFPGYDINDQDVMAFFYMKTDADMPTSVVGVTGISANLQFLSSGTVVYTSSIMSYSGAEIGWTKFQTNSPVRYRSGNVTPADSVRIAISASITNDINIYIDNVYVGLTNVIPSWSASAADAEYSDTLIKSNISSTNTTTTNLDVDNLVVTTISSQGSGTSAMGTISDPFTEVVANDLYLGGAPINIISRRFASFSNGISGNTFSWTVPANVTSIMVDMVGAGGGGAAGSDDSSSSYGGPFTTTNISSNPISIGTCGNGGGGGGAGEYVRQTISVIPGEILVISAGIGGAGGLDGTFGDPASKYYGKDGTDSRIIRNASLAGSTVISGIDIAKAAGGLGGGSKTSVADVKPGGVGGGVTIFSDNKISIAGKSGSNGQMSGTRTGSTVVIYNDGGNGASLNTLVSYGIGGLHGNGSITSTSTSTSGASAVGIGAGGGGGGGSFSGSAGQGGRGGAGKDGIVIIYY